MRGPWPTQGGTVDKSGSVEKVFDLAHRRFLAEPATRIFLASGFKFARRIFAGEGLRILYCIAIGQAPARKLRRP